MVNDYGKHDGSKRLGSNFRVREFACKCGCGRTLVDEKLVDILQAIRDYFDASVTITSGYRCPEYNKALGNASTKSRHMEGKAADIVVKGVKPAEVARYAESIGATGIGLYEGSDGNFVHVDTRPNKCYWYGQSWKVVNTFGGAKMEVCDVKLNVLKKGAKGATVKALQALLIGYGYSCGSSGVDGSFGSATDKAVRAYQKDTGLTVDGSVGAKTWASLLGV